MFSVGLMAQEQHCSYNKKSFDIFVKAKNTKMQSNYSVLRILKWIKYIMMAEKHCTFKNSQIQSVPTKH